MEEEKLKNEIKKVREVYADLESSFELCNQEFAEAMDNNRSLQEDSRALKEKIVALESESAKYADEKKVLLESKRVFCDDIQKMRQDTSAQDTLKANLLTLEEQLTQLRKDLANAQIQNSKYFQENSVLNECLVNANNEIEEKSQKITSLTKQVQDDTMKVDKLKQNVQDLNDELQQNLQNRNDMLEVLQKNRALTTGNNQLKKELKDVLESNDKIQLQTSEDEHKMNELKNTLHASEAHVKELTILQTKHTKEISELITKLTELEANLKDVTETKDDLKLGNSYQEAQLTQLNLSVKHLEQLYGTASKQLLYVLEETNQLEKELKAITSTERASDAIQDLKLALLTCMITTRKALDKLRNLPENLSNDDDEDNKNSGFQDHLE